MEIVRVIRSAANDYHAIQQNFGASRAILTTHTTRIYRSRDDSNVVINPPESFSTAVTFTQPSGDIPIVVSGTFAFPLGNKTYRLRCRPPAPPGGAGPDTYSDNFTVKGDGTVKPFMASRFMGLSSESPFHLTGDWKFRLEDLSNAQFVRQPHQLEYLRLAVPPYDMVENYPWIQAERNVVGNLVENMWNLGLNRQRHYDIDGGRSMHLVNFGGWIFIASSFVTRSEIRCNCADLAFMTYVLCDQLGQRPTAGGLVKVIDATIMNDAPWGYVRYGPLFGFDAPHPSRHCNSPIWGPQFSYIHMNQPWDMPANDPNRTKFDTHTYVLYNSGGQHLVIDLTQAAVNGAGMTMLRAGLWNQNNFWANTIDQGYVAVNSHTNVGTIAMGLLI